MTTSLEAPPPSRLSQAKLDRVLKAARAAFLEHGFHGASTDMIQAASGVSKSTLYRYFATKELLFEAAIEAGGKGFLQHIGEVSEPYAAIDDFLRVLGLELLEGLLSPEALALVRLMVMESQRFPRLTRHFYMSGPKGVVDLTEVRLAKAHADGQLWAPEPAAAAERFIGMIRGETYLRCLLGVAGPPPAAGLKRQVEATVAAFLAAQTAP